MTPLWGSLQRSLFLRLILIFGSTAILFLLIGYFSLQQIGNYRESDNAGPIPDFYIRNLPLIIDEIGTPPSLDRALKTAQDLSWKIVIRSPLLNWQSDNDNDLDISRAVYSRDLTSNAKVMTIDQEDVILVEKGGYEYFLNQKQITLSDNDYLVIYAGLALSALVLFFNYLLVRKLLNPVRLLQEGAERICEGDLSYRVESGRTDELGELTDSVNHMADSLQSMLEAKRQLLLAISHELRTPITRAKLQLEFMDEGDIRTNLNDDINEIDSLISDLLEAERLNNEHAALLAESVDFADFIDHVLEPLRGYSGGLEYSRPHEDREVSLDKLRTRLLLTNLINNAMRHGENSPITVTVSFLEKFVALEVKDQGEGIAKEYLKHLGEPFYRPDSARQRNTGGTGLGLYLCRLIAIAHGGKLEIQSTLGIGTQVLVNLPYELERS